MARGFAAVHPNQEDWRTIPDQPDYQASDQGRIRSLKAAAPKVLRPSTNRNGYKRVVLWMRGKASTHHVHRLVLAAFDGTKERLFAR